MSGGNVKVQYDKLEEAVQVHQKALDDLVTVNSLFTAAVFVGLAFANPGKQIIEGAEQCEAGNHVARRLVKNEVISFACYLLSSLVAKALKTHLFTYLIDPPLAGDIKDKWSKVLRGSLFALSTSASIVGGVFLLISMVDMIQLRLGKIICGGTQAVHAFGALVAVNILALVIYVPFVGDTIYRSTMMFDNLT
ncbi:uncharacterized protein LOC115739159 [Rhodamnia argentea]|uniref:Uncharacterized protein LOC115739159 n=1 Tax=Rhodamnia argentea TaxID=178133 RepID=A0A8B8NZJ2_9MYRT|nr:uncharacterized protein LOC115739159 [Rhodamnia argentea]